jgi:hypothetical protein
MTSYHYKKNYNAFGGNRFQLIVDKNFTRLCVLIHRTMLIYNSKSIDS